MDIRHKGNSGKGVFYVEQEGVILAEMAYVWAGSERIIIEHTSVDELL